MTFHLNKTDQSGFTILELLIATAVLSVILLLSTISIISIGNLYYKGEKEAAVQDDVRTIANDVSQRLELAASVNNPSAFSMQNGVRVYALCIDNTRYTYALGVDIDSTTPPILPHVLWRDTITSATFCAPANLRIANPTLNGTEMIAAGSRLTSFNLNSPNSPYTFTVGVAFGDPTMTNMTSDQTSPQSVVCNGGPGDQYCATSYLSTIVDKRLNN